jgi:hypothetical protein
VALRPISAPHAPAPMLSLPARRPRCGRRPDTSRVVSETR